MNTNTEEIDGPKGDTSCNMSVLNNIPHGPTTFDNISTTLYNHEGPTANAGGPIATDNTNSISYETGATADVGPEVYALARKLAEEAAGATAK
jgi:hypothetical protein